MPIINSWDNDDRTIIRMEISGTWTWDELSQAVDETTVMVDSVKHIVYGIVDLSQSQHIPGNFIPNVRSLMKKRHPRSGMEVIVGASALLIGLWRVFERVYTIIVRKQDFTFVSTLDEAHTILQLVMEQSASVPAEKE